MPKKLTNEDIVKRIYDLVGDEYSKLDEVYLGSKTKFPIKHNTCGHEYEVRWNDFQGGSRCPKCSGLMKLTNENIVERIYELVGNEYSKLNDIYVNANTKFPIKHNICGHKYEVSWGNFQSGFRCPKCSGLIKLTNNDVVERMYRLVGDEYIKLDDIYVNNSTKFPIRHNECGHEYEITWNTFQNGIRCSKCSGKYRYTDSEMTEMISDMTNGEYTKLGIYINSSTKFSIKHNTCGHEYEVAWDNFNQGNRCPKCSGLMKLTNENIVQRMYDLVGDEYTKLDEVYLGSKTKFPIKHNICGHKYEVSWNEFKGGNRCPKCNQSKGEKFISDYLTNKHIPFTTQVRFNDCRHKNTLPFDFGIVNDENIIIALIEFDGRQHFEPVERFGGEEVLALTQLRDQIKNQYCKDNNIPLLRIRYDEDIEEKLIEFLKELDLIHKPLLKTV